MKNQADPGTAGTFLQIGDELCLTCGRAKLPSGPSHADLLAEVERLRIELETSRERHAADAHDLEQARVTVRDESRRAYELEEEIAALRADGGIQAMGRLNKRVTDQRDALANALYGMWLIGGAEERRDAESALRLVGRLPTEGGQDDSV